MINRQLSTYWYSGHAVAFGLPLNKKAAVPHISAKISAARVSIPKDTYEQEEQNQT